VRAPNMATHRRRRWVSGARRAVVVGGWRWVALGGDRRPQFRPRKESLSAQHDPETPATRLAVRWDRPYGVSGGLDDGSARRSRVVCRLEPRRDPAARRPAGRRTALR